MGKLSDKIGKYTVFCIGTAISIVMVAIYVHLGVTPLWLVILTECNFVCGHFIANDFGIGSNDGNT
jgi:Na+/melibiose symporter-like transporter